MSGFTKLWAEITDSSIWNEDDKTRIVWITMLARMGPDYMVRASVGGLAHLARVSREDCEKAIEKLSSPDPDSRSTEFEGRRIELVEGGFFILNGEKHRARRNYEERKEYMKNYMKNYRKQVNTRKQKVNTVSSGKPPLAQAEAEPLLEDSPQQSSKQTQKKEKQPDPAPPCTGTAQDQDPWSNLGTTGKPLQCPKEEHTEVLNRIFNGVTQKKQELYQSKAKK